MTLRRDQIREKIMSRVTVDETNRLCVRPEPKHLQMVTCRENHKRRVAAAKNGMMGRNSGLELEDAE